MPPLGFGSNILIGAALRQLGGAAQKNRALSEQLSRGQRLSGPAEDAVGVALSSALNSRSAVLSQGAQNVSQGQSLLSIAETALTDLTDVVTSMSDLATEATDKTLTRAQRQALQEETDALTTEFNRILSKAELYGVRLLDRSTTSLPISAGPSAQNTVSTSLGEALARSKGSGSVTTASTFISGATTDSALVDVNNDGNLDLITALSGSAVVNVRLGTGTGSFGSATTLTTSNAGGLLATGDINGDGYTDLVRVGSSKSATFVNVMLNNTVGAFSSATTATSSGVSSATGIFLGDLNGDQRQDVIWGSATKGVYTNIATTGGGLGSSTQVYSGTSLLFAAADFSGDNVPDLLIADNSTASSTTLKLLEGDGSGGFRTATSIGVLPAYSISNLVANDFNRDGLADFTLTTSELAYDIINDVAVVVLSKRVWLNQGSSSFSTLLNGNSNSLDISINPTDAVDINNDGIVDLLGASSGTLRVAKGNGDGSFQTSSAITISAVTPSSFGDLNNDGITDVVSIGSLTRVSLQGVTKTTTLKTISLTSAADASAAARELTSTQNRIDVELANVTSAQGRLQGVYDGINETRRNTAVAVGRILDINRAELEAKLAAGKIRERAAQAIVAQATQSAPRVAALLDPAEPVRSVHTQTLPRAGPAPTQLPDTTLSEFGDPNPIRSAVLPISDSEIKDIAQWRLKLP